ncbi:hypothetical protein GBA52_021227 [Prunus armeniaca]|nr:hypothetical protein GBA52_021227 [Prunus armeniaca]
MPSTALRRSLSSYKVHVSVRFMEACGLALRLQIVWQTCAIGARVWLCNWQTCMLSMGCWYGAARVWKLMK